MYKSKISLCSALIAAAMCAGMPTAAAPIVATAGSTVVLDFNGFYSSDEILIPGLSGLVTLSNFVFTPVTIGGNSATRVNFNYSIANDSSYPVLASRISNFAFDTTPTLLNTSQNQVNGVFDTIVVNANQPNGIGTVEVCFTDANCPGGGSGGVTKGDTEGGTARLHFGGTVSSFTIDNAVVRYQSVYCAYGSPCSNSASGELVNGSGGGQVPEPSTYLLMSLGIGGVAMASRYKRQ